MEPQSCFLFCLICLLVSSVTTERICYCWPLPFLINQPHWKVYRLVANHQNAQEKTLQLTGKRFYLVHFTDCPQTPVSMAFGWDGISFTTNLKNTIAIRHHMRWQCIRSKPHYPAQTVTSSPWIFVLILNDFSAWPNIFLIRYLYCEVTWIYIRNVSLFLLKNHAVIVSEGYCCIWLISPHHKMKNNSVRVGVTVV